MPGQLEPQKIAGKHPNPPWPANPSDMGNDVRVFHPKRLIFQPSLVQKNTHSLFRRFVALGGGEEAAGPVSFRLAPMLPPFFSPRREAWRQEDRIQLE